MLILDMGAVCRRETFCLLFLKELVSMNIEESLIPDNSTQLGASEGTTFVDMYQTTYTYNCSALILSRNIPDYKLFLGKDAVGV